VSGQSVEVTPPLPQPTPPPRPGRRRDPLWARLVVVLGALLILFSGAALVGGAMLSARYDGAVHKDDLLAPDEERQSEIDPNRPLNMLLVGVDERPGSTDPARGDSIIMVHIPAGHKQAYLLSLPRDLIVEIPASPPGRKRATHEKLNGAYPYGVENFGGLAGGFQLLSRTIENLVNIKFDIAAVINFEGFRAVVRELGGVHMCLDHDVRSEHLGTGPDGQFLAPEDGGKPFFYPAGCHDLGDLQALDVVRQRKSLPNGDYDRQRNQQKFLKAVMQKATSEGIVSDPKKLDAIVRKVGAALTFDSAGISTAELAFSLRNIRENNLVMVRTPGHGVGVGNGYQGEELDPLGVELLSALGNGQLDTFVVAHPELVNPA
jgi:LCP family protein required for cell wall assembly